MTWFLLSLVLGAGILLRLSSLRDPLDADAGAHFYYAQHRRTTPQLHYNVISGKPPGLYFINCLVYDLLGKSTVVVHGSLVIAHTLTSFFVFLVGREIGGDAVGLCAALMYGVTSAVPEFRSGFSHPENYLTLFSTIGIFIALKGFPGGSSLLLFLSGLAMGMAYLCKQTGMLVFGLLMLWGTVVSIFHPAMEFHPWACAALVCGFVVPPLLTLPLFASEGKKHLKNYSSNVLLQPVRAAVGKDSYVAQHYKKTIKEDLSTATKQFKVPLRETLLVWLLACAALPYASTTWGCFLFISLWSLIMIAAGLIQRHYATHHFLPALPGASLLAGHTLAGMVGTSSSISARRAARRLGPGVPGTTWTNRAHLRL
ncbi:ArnT family glycosyltransferase [Candidatus Hydrogenedentota bacterium]